jgi:hypothetical protein
MVERASLRRDDRGDFVLPLSNLSAPTASAPSRRPTTPELKAKTLEFRDRLAKGATTDDLLVEAFAVVKNACRRLCGPGCAGLRPPGALGDGAL